jgi:hypothetical protein
MLAALLSLSGVASVNLEPIPPAGFGGTVPNGKRMHLDEKVCGCLAIIGSVVIDLD